MSINDFIADLEIEDSKFKGFFSDSDKLIKSLKKLDNVIGMKLIKSEIIKQIKTFIGVKTKGIYKDKDRKHCLLLGGPGTGKTTVGKILCEIWMAIGFIGEGKNFNKKVSNFNKVQDELIRSQRSKIRELEDKIKMCSNHVGKVKRVDIVNKRIINNLIRIKDQSIEKEIIDKTISELSSINKIVKQTDDIIHKIINQKNPLYEGFGIEPDSSLTNKQIGDDDIPFFIYTRQDVVDKYLGGTAVRVHKAMTDALGGVAYFDEAYNLCNDSSGSSDPYGREALTTINQFMDEQSDKLIVVFAGYKDDIYNNLFQVQKGLESRFTNKFVIEAYTGEELAQIYIQRLSYCDWYIRPSKELDKIIIDNLPYFEYQGRDMDNLAIYTKNIVSVGLYDKIKNGESISNQITDLNIVRKAVQIFKENMVREVGDNESRDSIMKLMKTLSK